jgi:acetyl esterase
MATKQTEDEQPDRGAAAGRRYLERGEPVTVIVGWRGKGPRNVLIQRADGSLVVRPFRGLRRASR